jgi:Tol biopolymer transport system component
MLLSANGQVLERDKLREALWPSGTHVEFEAGLNAAVNRLRRVLNENADSPRYIETLPRLGYRFVAPVETLPVSDPPSQPPTPPTTTPPTTTPPTPRRPLWFLAGGAALILTAIALILYTRRPPSFEDLVKEGRPFTTSSGNVQHPSISPDGLTVAFDWDGPEGANRDVWLQRLDSDTPVRFTEREDQETWPVWSPDGARLAFLRRISQKEMAIVTKPLLGGTDRELTRFTVSEFDRPRLDWSRDGVWLITSTRTHDHDPSRLLLINASNSEHKLLPVPPPDAKSGDTEAVFSPDGRNIAFRRTVSSGVEDVYVSTTQGENLRRITNDNRGIAALTWRADGRTLLISSRRSGAFRQLWEFQLTPGTPPRRITPAVIDAGGPAVSRDGRTLLFVQTHEDKNIYRADWNSPAPPQRITTALAQDSDPSLSPDGNLVAFRSSRTGSDEIWIADLTNNTESRLTRMNGPTTGSPRWSPDGSQIAFDSVLHGKADIFLVPAKGGAPKAITPPQAHDASPAWSADGKCIYYSSNRSGTSQIWRQSLQSGSAEQITSDGGGSPKLSRDGATLFFTRSDKSALGLFSLALNSPLPAPGRKLLNLDRRLAGHWTIAESGIYFVLPGEKTRSALQWSDFQASRRKLLFDFPGMPSFFDGGLSISSKETTVYFTKVDRTGSNLVAAQLPARYLPFWPF